MLTFVKDYKNDDGLRQSFDALAKNTFGISFEAWYQNGCWDDNYITYSFHDAGKIVANASANRMTIKMKGVQETVSAIQIGTVMTDPAYRRKGLAYALIQKIFEDFDGEVSLYYLAADLDAKPLYEKCGFVEVPETCYHYVQQPASSIIGTPENESLTLNKITLSLEAFLHWKRNAMSKGCAFDVKGDAHIAAFYWFHGIKEKLYTLGDDCLVIADISEDGRKMTLLDYYVMDARALNKQSLNEQELESVHLKSIIKAITRMPESQIEKVDFAFDMTGISIPLESLFEDKSGWMIRTLGDVRFPETFCYPKLAQA
jgi:GNAT superfamily N-acetyltransferase